MVGRGSLRGWSACALILFAVAVGIGTASELPTHATTIERSRAAEVPAASRTPKGPSAHGLEVLPPRARSVVSGSLGATLSAFRGRRVGNGFRLSGGGVNADLSTGGVF